MAAIGGEAAASYKPPRQPSHLIVCFVSIPNLISQFLINQQGFDVDFGEHPGIHTKSLAVFHYHYWAKQ